MKIVFFGTPDFAVYSLKSLFESEHEIAAVVTAPDKQRGRGRKVSFTPVKQYALENGIDILQPEKLKDSGFVQNLQNYNADLYVVVAFRILPEVVFTIPPMGTFNLHGSLLPKYRGAAPIQWALINGDTETGLTTFFLKKKVDTGNIIIQKKLAIQEQDNFESLHDKMAELGASLVLETVEIIEKGNIIELPQDDTQASPAPKITKEICKIDWNKSAREIHNLVRGLSPFPGAFFIRGQILYKVFKTEISSEYDLKPGEVKRTKTSIYIGCAESGLMINEIQKEGRKRMSAEEFLRGYSLI